MADETLRPNSDVLVACSWIGSANHFENVDEAAPNDADYNYTYGSTIEQDTLGLPPSSGAGPITNVSLRTRLETDETGVAAEERVRPKLVIGGSPYYGTTRGPGTPKAEYTDNWATNPAGGDWSWADIDALEIGYECRGDEDEEPLPTNAIVYQQYIIVTYTPVVLPTVTTQAASSVEANTATGNGNITNTGGENCDKRGIVYDLASHGDPGNVAPGASGYGDFEEQTDSFGTGAFTRSLSGLSTGRTYYARAYAHNSAGYSYGGEISFLTKPAAPTSVDATDGDHSDKVVITWAKSTGATGYQVYRDGAPLGWLGDVATYDDAGAGAPTITPGNAVASDGTSTAHVALSLAGTGTSNGTTHTYKVRAKNGTGESGDSGTNTGYRAPGALAYQWQRSAADGDAGYGNIGGATASTYNDTGAPAPTVTPGTATAGDGASTAHVTLSLAGEAANIGAGRWYKCSLTADGCAAQTSGANRGYRSVGALGRQWYRSSGDSDDDYGVIGGATTDPYNDTAAPAPTVTPGTATAGDGASTAHVTLSLAGESANIGAGRYYKCLVSATGATSQYSTANRGYRGVGGLTRQWYRSAGDSNASYGVLAGATTDPYNDATAPAPTITPGTGAASDGTSPNYVALSLSGHSTNAGAGRWYKCLVSATGAASQYSTANRGYRGVGAHTFQWQRSAGDSDAAYGNIGGATTAAYNDTGAPANGQGRYFKCVENADGAAEQTSSADRGYRWIGGETAHTAAKMIAAGMI